MNNENASKEMVKSFIDLAKGLIDENKQPSGGRGDESGELHSVGAVNHLLLQQLIQILVLQHGLPDRIL